jgi:hypothetical protein
VSSGRAVQVSVRRRPPGWARAGADAPRARLLRGCERRGVAGGGGAGRGYTNKRRPTGPSCDRRRRRRFRAGWGEGGAAAGARLRRPGRAEAAPGSDGVGVCGRHRLCAQRACVPWPPGMPWPPCHAMASRRRRRRRPPCACCCATGQRTRDIMHSPRRRWRWRMQPTNSAAMMMRGRAAACLPACVRACAPSACLGERAAAAARPGPGGGAPDRARRERARGWAARGAGHGAAPRGGRSHVSEPPPPPPPACAACFLRGGSVGCDLPYVPCVPRHGID